VYSFWKIQSGELALHIASGNIICHCCVPFFGKNSKTLLFSININLSHPGLLTPFVSFERNSFVLRGHTGTLANILIVLLACGEAKILWRVVEFIAVSMVYFPSLWCVHHFSVQIHSTPNVTIRIEFPFQPLEPVEILVANECQLTIV